LSASSYRIEASTERVAQGVKPLSPRIKSRRTVNKSNAPWQVARIDSQLVGDKGIGAFCIDHLEQRATALFTRIRGKAITFIPQDPLAALNPLFPVGVQLRDMLKWGMRRGRRAREIRAHIISILQQVQIPSPAEQLRKYPHEFSGGQRQRLVIAAALAPAPTLIIADEPTSALDVTVQAQILLLLKSLVQERGTSVLLITHDLGVVAKLCDRVVVMYAGQEAEMAPTASAFTHPSHPYTWKLLESLPERQQGDIRGIPGVVPHLIDPPPGCRFHTRCEFAMPRCMQHQPAAMEVLPDHWVRCHLFPGEGSYACHA